MKSCAPALVRVPAGILRVTHGDHPWGQASSEMPQGQDTYISLFKKINKRRWLLQEVGVGGPFSQGPPTL